MTGPSEKGLTLPQDLSTANCCCSSQSLLTGQKKGRTRAQVFPSFRFHKKTCSEGEEAGLFICGRPRGGMSWEQAEGMAGSEGWSRAAGTERPGATQPSLHAHLCLGSALRRDPAARKLVHGRESLLLLHVLWNCSWSTAGLNPEELFTAALRTNTELPGLERSSWCCPSCLEGPGHRTELVRAQGCWDPRNPSCHGHPTQPFHSQERAGANGSARRW